MRVTSILLAGAFALFANAQNTAGNAAPTATDAATAAQNSEQAEMIRCIEACRAGDVVCTSKCVAVPSPNESQVNATNTCVAGCPQGDGSEAASAQYNSCVQACIGQHYYTASVGTPQPTGGPSGNGNGNGKDSGNGKGNGNSNNDGDGNKDTSDTNGDGESATGTEEAAASETPGAAGALRVSGAAAGLVGFLAAMMAL
ncbi:hypothetical protein VTK26DRAFT_7236 [Humicola hyalothermophila]